MEQHNFNRLKYDTCTYSQDLKQSVGVSDYVLGLPRVHCSACFPYDPMTSVGYAQASVPQATSLVDLDSELMGITRKASNCPSSHYVPDLSKPEFERFSLAPIQDCRSIPNEGTRLSNPPCTLREQGWNRWEHLKEDPQKTRAEVPFRFNVNNRLVVKDNHRPLVQTPINQSHALPPFNRSDEMYTFDPKEVCQGVQASIQSANDWETCGKLNAIL